MKILRTLMTVVVAAQMAFPPVYAADDTPYFRLRSGQSGQGATGGGDGTGGTGTGGTGTGGTGGTTNPGTGTNNPGAFKVTGGPGSGKVRTGKPVAYSAPTATRSPVTWSLEGAGIGGSGLSVASGTGVVSGIAGAPATYGPMRLTATYAPDGGASERAAGGDFSLVVMGNPFLAYQAPAVIGGGVQHVIEPKTLENVDSPTFSLNQAVPAGLQFSTTNGSITVLPTATGSYSNLVVTVRDSDGASYAASPVAFDISNRPVSLSMPSTSGVLNVPFSNAITQVGLTDPVTYDLFAGGLPDGLSFCSAPDRVCGTPTIEGNYTGIIIRGTGADGVQALSNPQSPITIGIRKPSLSYAGRTVNVNAPFTINPSASDLDGSTFAFKGTAPAGVTVNRDTGVVSGTLDATAPVTLTVVATSRYASYESNAFTLTGKLDAFSVSSTAYGITAHVGYPVSVKYTASPADASTTWSVAPGAQLPVGVALDPRTGLVSGAGTAPATVSNVVVQATRGSDVVPAAPASFNILAAPSVNVSPSYTATIGEAFQTKISAANLIGDGIFATDNAKLPPGLTLAADGTLKGVATTEGNYDGIVVNVADAYDGATGQGLPFSIQVIPASTDLQVTNVPSQYRVRQAKVLTTQKPTVVNAQSAVAWTLAPDSARLPDGTTLDEATGIITGTPTAPGDTANIILLATETGTKTGSLDAAPRVRLAAADDSWMTLAATPAPRRSARSRPFVITVGPQLAVTNVNGSYTMRVAGSVSVAPVATGVLGSTTWRLSGATLPQALGFDPSTGRIAGPALAPGRVPDPAPNAMKLTAVDSFDGATATSPDFSFQVEPGLVVVGPSALTALAGRPYASGVAYTATNASRALSWSVVGTLPDGLGINGQTGEITGVPTKAQTVYGLRMQASQVDGQTGLSAPFTFAVRGGIEVTAPTYNVAHVNRRMPPVVPTVTGGIGTLRWFVASGSLPPGVAMDMTSGTLYGTPTATGIFHNILIGASDASGNSGVSNEVIIDVNNGMSWASTTSAPPIRRGKTFTSTPLRVNGAAGAVSYRLLYSPNNNQWTIDAATGVITGIGTGDWMWPDWLLATDSTGATLSHPLLQPQVYRNFEYPGRSSADTIAKVPFSAGAGNTFNSVGRVTWTKVGTWPDWLNLDESTGYVSGIPPVEGAFEYTTRVIDAWDGQGGDFVRTVYVRPSGEVDPANMQIRTRSSDYWRMEPYLTAPDSVVGNVAWKATGLPGGSYINGNNRTMNLYLPYPAPGLYKGVALTATGDGGGTFTQLVDITVNPALSIQTGAAKTCAMSGEFFDTGPATLGGVVGTPTIRMTDFYDTSVPYNGWPAWLQVDNTTGRISGTVPADATANYGNRYGAILTDSFDGRSTNAYYKGFRSYEKLSFDPPPFAAVGYKARTPDGYGQENGTKMTLHGVVDGWNFQVEGQLPEGMRLDGQYLVGNPVAPGDYTVRITLNADQCGTWVSSSRIVTIKVVNQDPLKWLSTPVTVYARTGVPFRSAPVPYIANRGTEIWSYNHRNCERPSGVNFDSGNGTFYGTPNQTWNGCYRLEANSNRGEYTLGTWSQIVVTPGPKIEMQDLSIRLGSPSQVKPNASGFSGEVTWTVTGSIPDGMSFDANAGAIIGTPTTKGTFGPLTFSAVEKALPAVGPNDPTPAYPAATSNTFKVTVVDGPSISGVANQTRVIGKEFALYPQAVGFTGTVTWVVNGDLPDGVAIDRATGAISGVGIKYQEKVVAISAYDTDGNAATSKRFSLAVTDPDGQYPAVQSWAWGDQVCTYSCRADGSCSGRQLQVCTGSGCSVEVRGCDAPYRGGDTSNPVGSLATSCNSPTDSPNESFCPIPTGPEGPVPTWKYYMYYLQTKHTNGFVVNHYQLRCFVGANAVDDAQCGTSPTAVTQCAINGYGIGYCDTSVPTADGAVQRGFGGPAGWYD